MDYGEHRDGAIRRLDHALSQLQLLGLKNNIAFLRRVLTHPDHIAGKITTGFIAQHLDLLRENEEIAPVALIAAAIGKTSPPLSMATERHAFGYWRNNAFGGIQQEFKQSDRAYTVLLSPQGEGKYQAQVGDQTFAVQVWQQQAGEMSLSVDGHRQQVTYAEGSNNDWWLHINGYNTLLTWISPLPEGGRSDTTAGSLVAPMPGQIRAVFVEIGQKVLAGEVLLILEAMKMEHRIKAPYAGEVSALYYLVGQSVQADAVLLELKSDSD